MLDAGVVVPGWKRTGMAFKVSDRGAGLGLPACRFFGTPGVGPNSHFYTIDAAECAKVKANPRWTLRGLAFAVEAAGRRRLPEPGASRSPGSTTTARAGRRTIATSPAAARSRG